MRRYEFTDKGWDYDILLRNKITVIDGDSGNGKSVLARAMQSHFVFNKMKAELLDYNAYENTEKVTKTITSYADTLIIIDNADCILNGDIVDLINNDINNFYVVFGRKSWGLSATPSHFAELEQDSTTKKIALKYSCDVENWI